MLYANHYQAPRVNDGRGNSAVPGFKLSADVMAGRIFYMSNATHRNGVGDITVGPTLGWDFGAFHPLVAMDLVLPVGGYGTDRARLPSCGVAPEAPAPPRVYQRTRTPTDALTELFTRAAPPEAHSLPSSP